MGISAEIDMAPAANPLSNTAKLFAIVPLFLLSSTLNAQTLYFNIIDGIVPEVDENYEALSLPEGEYSAYDRKQIDPLVDQGRVREEQGDFLSALSYYKQALNVARVNNGLYHESQIDILDRIIESEMAMENWAAVDNQFAYMELLYNRLFPDNDYRLEDGLRKVVSWHVTALNRGLDDKRVEHLEAADRLFRLRLGIAERTLATNDPKYSFLKFSISITERQLFLASDLHREMFGSRRVNSFRDY
ncbi:MAG: hypothetical protein HOA33_01365 [Gammaproteobacteria bacterium]|jgi:tetratricopeptide (TPR) repeat protein|nr:hypothetical protein [Gammaproteobacteria bacterium]MBT4255367.1 hypothetical protein [Gammaproteobacteria bacterium]MBT4580728.1 hypothetical protein [Gammaproteobacteria bacterium]MBT4658663.1 hypothetical protein [Gammaproteobacteria bacterium]MBT4893433.1 hypothetical protein [Gammaproteobacteria bacterium]